MLVAETAFKSLQMAHTALIRNTNSPDTLKYHYCVWMLQLPN